MLVFSCFLPGLCKDGTASVYKSSDTATLSASSASKNFIEPAAVQGTSSGLSFFQDNTISAFMTPSTIDPQVLGSVTDGSDSGTGKEITEYTVQSGDSLGGIAQKFGISLDTVLWANNLSQTSVIQAGQTLVISPVTGVIYHVQSGDTVSGIAKKFDANTDDILTFNNLSGDGDIFVGDILVIPNGIMTTAAVASTPAPIPIASSYFICPIAPPCRVTQGLHFYNAIDFSHGKCGDYIYAVAAGVVEKVEYGWNGGAGNTIFVLHPNGVATSYGHILSSLVTEGEHVSQGQPIALMGGDPSIQGVDAGIVTGCHVHFAVHGGANPFAGYVAGQIVPIK